MSKTDKAAERIVFYTRQENQLVECPTVNASWMYFYPRNWNGATVYQDGFVDGLPNADRSKIVMGRISRYITTFQYQPGLDEFEIQHDNNYHITLEGMQVFHNGETTRIRFDSKAKVWLAEKTVGFEETEWVPAAAQQVDYYRTIRNLKKGAALGVWVAYFNGVNTGQAPLLDYYAQHYQLPADEQIAEGKERIQNAITNSIEYTATSTWQAGGVLPVATPTPEGPKYLFPTTDGLKNLYEVLTKGEDIVFVHKATLLPYDGLPTIQWVPTNGNIIQGLNAVKDLPVVIDLKAGK